MNFDVSIIGYAAGICSAVAQFPQAIKVYRTGDTRSISLSMYSIMTLGVAFWFAYGLALNMLPMILANGICLIPSLYVLAMAVFKKKK